jgi:RNA polymerase sigma-70 factor (ECF subfamily)
VEDVVVGRFSQLPDDELLALTPSEPEAFGAFYERHVRLVLGVLMRETRDAERALDLTAEVFAAALAAAGRFKVGGPPASAWLIGIARNKLAAVRRKEALGFAARSRLGIPVLSFDDEEIARVEEMVDADRAGYLRALAELPASEREAIHARVLEDRAYSDIAAAEGTTEAAIRQRVSRGLARLGVMGRQGR